MFDIATSRDFLLKLEAEYADFKAQPDSARHALNCIITAYHLGEWVWGDWLKTNNELRQKLAIDSKQTFDSWLDASMPAYALLQKMANGEKHFVRPTIEKTQRIAGYGCGPYGGGRYGQPYLLIDYGTETQESWITAEQLIDESVGFWREFFHTHRPEGVAEPEAQNVKSSDGFALQNLRRQIRSRRTS
jgi:hypothetical protein